MLKLNLGCGLSKLEGFVNVDIDPEVNPDVVADFTTHLPYENDSVDWIVMFHVIEHIVAAKHPALLDEIWRVLKPSEGMLIIAYPEFVKVAQNFIDNKLGMRAYWTATIYGRQGSPGDFHVALMYTPEFKADLESAGFTDLDIREQHQDTFNTVIRARKGERPESREDLMKREVDTYAGLVGSS